jgi:hypothetical protein
MENLIKGHKIIDAEKLNNLLKEILPLKISKFYRNFIAYKIAENEELILRKICNHEFDETKDIKIDNSNKVWRKCLYCDYTMELTIPKR